MSNNSTVQRYYISNLFRIRTWWFTLCWACLSTIPAYFLHAGNVLTAIIMGGAVFLSFWVWLRTQMVCHACGKALAVTRIAGQPEVCRHCNELTDSALREMGH